MTNTNLDNLKNFSSRMKFVRNYHGLKQTEISEMMGITSRTYWNYENRKQDVPGNFLIKFRDLFNVNLDWLLSGHGKPFLTKEYIEKEDSVLEYAVSDLKKSDKKIVLDLAKRLRNK